MFLHVTFKKNKASVLLLTLLTLSIMLFLGIYLLSFTLSGVKMAESQKYGAQAYYLAEAGVQEAIFKLKKDPVWKNAFETLPSPSDPQCSQWSISPYQRNGGLLSNGSYEITINNLGCAKAEIISKATINISNTKKAQRIIKVKVSKALGNPLAQYGLFTGGASGDVQITLANPVRIHNGNMMVENNLQVRVFSHLYVDEKALIGNNVTVDGSSQLVSTSTCAKNRCDSKCVASEECPPTEISMPALDFDSNVSTSFLSRAKTSDCTSVRSDGKTNCVFTTSEFETMLWNHYPDIYFATNTVVYVQGDINIRAGQNVVAAGALVSDRDINVGKNNCWYSTQWPYLRCGFSTVTILRPDNDFPSGLFAKRKFNMGGFFGIGTKGLFLKGLLYSGDEMNLSSLSGPITIYGGIIARKIDMSSIWQNFDIYLEPDVIIDTLGPSSYSPVIIIDYWEEEY